MHRIFLNIITKKRLTKGENKFIISSVKRKCFTLVCFMEKDLRYVELFEIYQGLLTERQRELFRSHYYYDLSLSEIAEPDGNTRQNVYMAIKKVKTKLDEYESLLKMHLKNLKLKHVAENLNGACEDVAKEILDIIRE